MNSLPECVVCFDIALFPFACCNNHIICQSCHSKVQGPRMCVYCKDEQGACFQSIYHNHLLQISSEYKTLVDFKIRTERDTKSQLLEEHCSEIRSIAFSPDGTLLASSGDDKTICVWDVRSRRCARKIYNYTPVLSIVFSPDGKLIAGGDTNDIILWKVESGERVKVLHGSNRYRNYRSISFSADGKIIAGAGRFGVYLFDMISGECIESRRSDDVLWSVAFSPDGQLIATGGDNCEIILWTVGNNTPIQILRGHSNRIWHVAFSPDGQYIASGSDDRTLKLWEVKSGICIRTFRGHDDWVKSVAFSRDGQFLISGSRDRSMKIWKVQTGECIQTFIHKHQVSSVACSPDGQFFASTGPTNSNYYAIQLWKFDQITKEEIKSV